MDEGPPKGLLETVLMICGMIILVTLICCTTYSCTSPTLVDQEQQAIRNADIDRVRACVSHGGSWMPVSLPSGGSEMSCVTPMTLPLVTQMNKPSA